MRRGVEQRIDGRHGEVFLRADSDVSAAGRSSGRSLVRTALLFAIICRVTASPLTGSHKEGRGVILLTEEQEPGSAQIH